MKTAAGLHDFEKAVSLRNKLRAMQELQRRVMFGDREFLDISKDKALADIAAILGLKNIPARIEGYDISHHGGQHVVASMVVFTNGASDRAEYRKFKVSEKNDDTGNMYEVILRRLGERNLKSWGKPDLMLIDGGRGQLMAAIKARDERGLKIPIISIAKREEEIIIHQAGSMVTVPPQLKDAHITHDGDITIINLHPGQINAGSHSKNLRGSTQSYRYSDITKLFQRIRDESHRFAISYHTTLKRQSATKNQLEDIPGVGPKTRTKLLKHFGSLQALRRASIEDIAQVVGAALAQRIVRHLMQ